LREGVTAHSLVLAWFWFGFLLGSCLQASVGSAGNMRGQRGSGLVMAWFLFGSCLQASVGSAGKHMSGQIGYVSLVQL